MSSTEIMEKVAAYKDEQIIILNQVNKVSETEQYSPIRADFFLAILCLRGKASLSLNNNSYEIDRNDLMICHPQTLLKHGMIGDDFECCGFCLSPEYAKRIFVMSTSANNWYSRLYLEQHPIIPWMMKKASFSASTIICWIPNWPVLLTATRRNWSMPSCRPSSMNFRTPWRNTSS